MTLISYYRSIKIYYFTIPQNSVIWTRLNIAYKQRYKHQWQLRVFLTLNYTYSSIWLTISLPKEVILTPEERFQNQDDHPLDFPQKGSKDAIYYQIKHSNSIILQFSIYLYNKQVPKHILITRWVITSVISITRSEISSKLCHSLKYDNVSW